MINRIAHPFISYCASCDSFRKVESLACMRKGCGPACSLSVCPDCKAGEIGSIEARFGEVLDTAS